MLRIYLDTSIWCRPFDAQTQKRVIEETEAFFKTLRKVDTGNVIIIGSKILSEEIEAMEEVEKKELVQKLMEMTISEWIDSVPEFYKDIMKTAELKLPDSAHLACAIDGGAKYFITVDDEILKKCLVLSTLQKNSEDHANRSRCEGCGKGLRSGQEGAVLRGICKVFELYRAKNWRRRQRDKTFPGYSW
ncbi:MAG: PIN domain-containing protein [Methanobacteriota archaeon]|nr:MAG: PIN domain-containing protein [Euryarchaeota archaeon]